MALALVILERRESMERKESMERVKKAKAKANKLTINNKLLTIN